MKASKIYKRLSLLKKFENNLNTSNMVIAQQLLETLSNFTDNQYNVYLVFQDLNLNIIPKLKKKTWKKKILILKRYKKSNFFKETINLVLIVITTKNSSQILAHFIADQLSTLKKQFFFLRFLKQTFNLFMTSSFSKLTGIKIVINGRFNRRPRSRNNIITIGNVPIQNLNANINYYQSTAFSSNGTFGIKVWVAEKPKY